MLGVVANVFFLPSLKRTWFTSHSDPSPPCETNTACYGGRRNAACYGGRRNRIHVHIQCWLTCDFGSHPLTPPPPRPPPTNAVRFRDDKKLLRRPLKPGLPTRNHKSCTKQDAKQVGSCLLHETRSTAVNS